MAQKGVGQHASDHRFADWHDADAEAWVVAAFGHDLRIAEVAGDNAAGEMESATGDQSILFVMRRDERGLMPSLPS
jgi:hypothetical protein